MKELPTFLKGNGDQNKFSSKRFVTFLLTVTLIVVVIANTFLGFEVKDYVFDGLVNVLIWSLGFVGSEQFAGALKSRYQQRNIPNQNYTERENF